LGKERKVKLVPIIELERLLRILVTNMDIERDSDEWIRRRSSEKIHNNCPILAQLCVPVRKEESNASGPRTKYPRPIGLGTQRAFRESLVLFNKRVTSSEVLWIIVVVVTLVH
jgi:hypothetical protein